MVCSEIVRRVLAWPICEAGPELPAAVGREMSDQAALRGDGRGNRRVAGATERLVELLNRTRFTARQFGENPVNNSGKATGRLNSRTT